MFQGDSITDGNRGRNDDPNHILGHSYAYIIGGKLGNELAEKQLKFYNRPFTSLCRKLLMMLHKELMQLIGYGMVYIRPLLDMT
jgi:hypothetical protein